MADGSQPRILDSFYQLCITEVMKRFRVYKPYIVNLPTQVRFKLYYQLYEERRLCILGAELSNLETFSKMLKVINRLHLLTIFQAPLDHKIRIAEHLVINYNMCCYKEKKNPVPQDKLINLGLELGEFLIDAGWYFESKEVLLTCKQLCLDHNQIPKDWCRTLNCCYKLLHAQVTYCDFEEATETYNLSLDMMDKLKSQHYNNINHAALFAEFSVLFFVRNEYNNAYKWSIEALKQLKPDLPAKIIVDVLRQAAKSCVVKGEFQKAGLLIKEAVYLAKKEFGTDHPKYSDVLIDYGFFLLNTDSISNSITVYEKALVIRSTIFDKTNLHVAIVHVALAYAIYVHEYKSNRIGRFTITFNHVIMAIHIMEKHVPPKHFMLAEPTRIKTLILEEIIVNHVPKINQNLLSVCKSLYLSSLKILMAAFPEDNVITATYYGNLGRLYQSMKKFKDAEKMFLQAIGIKERLLGPDHYKVGLSIGNLASLYNFHMNRYRDAEKLYDRNIAINLKLFGEGYSGLEYDYRGLIHVYEKLNDNNKEMEYRGILNQWKELRDQHAQCEEPLIDIQNPQPIADVMEAFFSCDI